MVSFSSKLKYLPFLLKTRTKAAKYKREEKMQEGENREILLHECHISILMTPVRFIVKEERACKNIAGKLRSLATFGSRAEGCWKVAPGAGLSRLSLPTPHSHSLARPARSLSHTRPFKCFHVVPSKLISGATRHLRR